MPEVLLKKGTAVAIKPPSPIVGTIKKLNVVDDGERVEYLVEWVEGEGEAAVTHERYFTAAELEVSE